MLINVNSDKRLEVGAWLTSLETELRVIAYRTWMIWHVLLDLFLGMNFDKKKRNVDLADTRKAHKKIPFAFELIPYSKYLPNYSIFDQKIKTNFATIGKSVKNSFRTNFFQKTFFKIFAIFMKHPSCRIHFFRIKRPYLLSSCGSRERILNFFDIQTLWLIQLSRFNERLNFQV